MLERYAVKVARTVLRGGSGSNVTSLPDKADAPKESSARLKHLNGSEYRAATTCQI